MRTTLNIDDDVLQAARELAAREKRSAGSVLSDLARRALSLTSSKAGEPDAACLGFEPFPKRGAVITNDLIDKIREQEGV